VQNPYQMWAANETAYRMSIGETRSNSKRYWITQKRVWRNSSSVWSCSHPRNTKSKQAYRLPRKRNQFKSGKVQELRKSSRKPTKRTESWEASPRAENIIIIKETRQISRTKQEHHHQLIQARRQHFRLRCPEKQQRQHFSRNGQHA